MTRLKGERLYVNVSASRARRRLKGFGHGVRKVHSAGRNQAVIIHTATGQHLRELEGLFADAQPTAQPSRDVPIENLRNLGPASGSWLREVGIATRADLERTGAVPAYQLVKQRRAKVSLNLLWAMAAGLREQDWRTLTDSEKRHLRSQLPDSG